MPIDPITAAPIIQTGMEGDAFKNTLKRSFVDGVEWLKRHNIGPQEGRVILVETLAEIAIDDDKVFPSFTHQLRSKLAERRRKGVLL